MPGTVGSPSVYQFRKADNSVVSINVVNLQSGAGTINATFVATAATSYMVCQVNSPGAGSGDFDDLRVVEV
jgi:hypothetical protein